MNTKEIKPLEIIKVLLLTDDDVEEPTYARVMKNKIKERSLLVLFPLVFDHLGHFSALMAPKTVMPPCF